MNETPRAPTPPPPGPRRTSRRWKIPVAALLLLAVAGVACAPWLLGDPGRMTRLAAAVLPELEGTVSFGAVRMGWLGPLVFEGIRVVPRDGSGAPLAVERVEVEHGLAAILTSFGDLGRVHVQGLEADVVFDEQRRSNLAGLIRAKPSASLPVDGQPRTSPVRMQLDVDDAIVRIAGPWSPDVWQSDPIDVRASLAPEAVGSGSRWTVEPVDLLTDARLEPGVAQGVLAYVAPVLAGATRTSGRFSLRLDGAELPVGRPADGRLSGTLSMHEVVVGPGPLVENLLTSLPVRLPVPPDIRIADQSHVAFRMADRRVAHEGLEFGLPLAKPGQRLDIQSSGTVALDDGALDLRLRLPIPADLPQDRPVLAALAGKSVSVGIRGELGAPRVVFDGSIKEAAGEFVGDLVDRLRAGTAGDGGTPTAAPSATGDTAEVVTDLVVGILEEVARRRAERRAAEEANPDAVPPRRLRDRLRRDRGVGPDPAP